ncbi:hypothetical protein B4168_3160 [Anoxybacillus flavithermus]|nr:hypothetical protein B4168_3160 [Anoxybacillus flavithermus]
MHLCIRYAFCNTFRNLKKVDENCWIRLKKNSDEAIFDNT